MPSGFHHHHSGGGWRGIYPVPVAYPVETQATDCQCKAGSSFEQKIKENPIVFVLGALLVGYLVAKKR